MFVISFSYSEYSLLGSVLVVVDKSNNLVRTIRPHHERPFPTKVLLSYCCFALIKKVSPPLYLLFALHGQITTLQQHHVSSPGRVRGGEKI